MSLPLPLLDGSTLVLDSTTTETFKLCPRKFYYEHARKRVRSSPKPAADFGGALHAALEVRYAAGVGVPTDTTKAAMHAAVDTAMQGIETPLEEWRTLARAHETVDLYNEAWGAEPFMLLGVEVPFAVPVGHVGDVQVIWSGRIDLVVQWEGHTYIVDHKTMSAWSGGKSGEFENSSQFKGYAWAMQEMHRLHGAPFPERVHGFCLNALVLRKPTNSARATLPRFEAHRTRCYYTQERLAEWREDLLAWVRVLLDHAERGYMPMNTRNCCSFYGGNCPMLDVCTSPPEQRDLILASDLYTDNVWDPITRGERVNGDS